jgi:hypothetical protein
MQLAEFTTQLERLRQAYGDRAFPNERERIFWQRYEKFSVARFEQVIDWIVLQMPPATQLVGILDDRLRESVNEIVDSSAGHSCPPCRDHGYGFVGDIVAACNSCERGRRISPAELAHHQASYNRGAKFLQRGQERTAFLPDLPYRPGERVGHA